MHALEHEFAQQRAATLGRLGRALEVALSALSQIDSPGQDRERLVEEASLALWHFVVQREACGLRDFAYVVRDVCRGKSPRAWAPCRPVH